MHENAQHKRMMESLGITRTTEFSYHFQGYHYQKLQDAISYAGIYAQKMSKMTPELGPDAVQKTD